MLRKKTDIKNGLVVGKFCPLHKGHEEILNFATASCEKLFIISYTKPEFPGCEPEKRRMWLKNLYSAAEILVLDDDLSQRICDHPVPHNNDEDTIHRNFCAKLCRDYFKMIPDAVFTCEPYGDGFADYLSKYFQKPINHILFGAQRAQDSISGTKIRADIHDHKRHLSAVVYQDFIKKICFLGAESTGKSTLAALCAKHYETTYIDEYGRTLWEQRDGHLTLDDMLLIAETHISAEERALEAAREFLFIDTSPLTTLFYSLQMFGMADPKLQLHAKRQYDEIFLCAPDFPLVQDGTRQNEGFRQEQNAWYLKELKERNISYTFLEGPLERKLETITTRLSA